MVLVFLDYSNEWYNGSQIWKQRWGPKWCVIIALVWHSWCSAKANSDHQLILEHNVMKSFVVCSSRNTMISCYYDAQVWFIYGNCVAYDDNVLLHYKYCLDHWLHENRRKQVRCNVKIDIESKPNITSK